MRLKAKYDLSQFKLCAKEKTADAGNDSTEFTVAVDNKNPSTPVDTGTSTPLDCNEISYWHFLPKDLVENIVLSTINESGLQIYPMYQNIIQACQRLVYVTLLYLRSLK